MCADDVRVAIDNLIDLGLMQWTDGMATPFAITDVGSVLLEFPLAFDNAYFVSIAERKFNCGVDVAILLWLVEKVASGRVWQDKHAGAHTHHPGQEEDGDGDTQDDPSEGARHKHGYRCTECESDVVCGPANGIMFKTQ